jgi:uncharacterized membrane protein YbaN (DUF454 family)
MRIFLFTVGIISLILGVIGTLLPVMPTTPFILLAAACFSRSSKKLHRLLTENKYFGHIIKNYEAGLGLSRKNKVRAIGMLWISITVSSIVSGNIIIFGVLATVSVGVTIYLLRLPTFDD